jgi:hypothetical protein
MMEEESSSDDAHAESPNVGTLRFAHPTDWFHGIDPLSLSLAAFGDGQESGKPCAAA